MKNIHTNTATTTIIMNHNEWMDCWKEGWMDGWIVGWMERWMDDGWMDCWMDGWNDGWMDGWMNDSLNDGDPNQVSRRLMCSSNFLTSEHSICDPIHIFINCRELNIILHN